MLEARRAERNYSLLRDTAYVNTNHDLLANVTDILSKIHTLNRKNKPRLKKLWKRYTFISGNVEQRLLRWGGQAMPLVISLKNAVDDAASGNYQIEF